MRLSAAHQIDVYRWTLIFILNQAFFEVVDKLAVSSVLEVRQALIQKLLYLTLIRIAAGTALPACHKRLA
jgi:hypothetical protein